MADIIVKDHIYNFMSSNNTAEAQNAIGITNSQIVIDNTVVRANSANWDNVYNHVQTQSANWIGGGSDVHELSANWQDTYTLFKSNSSNWDNTYSTVKSKSANWDSSYNTVKGTSGRWESVYNEVLTKGPIWDANSPTGNAETNLLVRSSSATWMTNIESFGVKGDGIMDVSPIVQNVLLNIQSGSTIYFPKGVYNFNYPVNILKPLTLKLHPEAIFRPTNRRAPDGTYLDRLPIIFIKSNDVTISGGVLSGDWDKTYYGTGRLSYKIPQPTSSASGLINIQDVSFASNGLLLPENIRLNIPASNIVNITIENVTFIDTPFVGIAGYFQSGLGNNDWAEDSGLYKKVGNIKIDNNKFIFCKAAGISLNNYKNRVAYAGFTLEGLNPYPENERVPLENIKYVTGIFITNNTFLSGGRSSTRKGWEIYNPQGMWIAQQPIMYVREGVTVSSIPYSNKMSISGLNFDQTSIGYAYEISLPSGFKTHNNLTTHILSSENFYVALEKYTLGVIDVKNNVAECIVLSTALPGGTWFENWNPYPNVNLLTSYLAITGNNDVNKTFSIGAAGGRMNYYDYSNGSGNFIGSVGPFKNVVIENNTFEYTGRIGIELYPVSYYPNESVTVRNNYFKNMVYYCYSINGINIRIENNVHYNCLPTQELFGKDIVIENNSFNSGFGLVSPRVVNHKEIGKVVGPSIDHVTFRNNYVAARPKDAIILGGDIYCNNWVIENNVLMYPQGYLNDYFIGDSRSFFNFKNCTNIAIRNNLCSIIGPVSAYNAYDIPRLFFISGRNITMTDNHFYLSGYGVLQDPYVIYQIYSLYNSNVSRNITITKNPINIKSYPLWDFSNQVNYYLNIDVMLKDKNTNEIKYYPLSGFLGYPANGGPLNGRSYPISYNIDDVYAINPVTDFTSDSTNKYYLSAWNNHRNQIAKYKGNGEWDYYDILDIVFDKGDIWPPIGSSIGGSELLYIQNDLFTANTKPLDVPHDKCYLIEKITNPVGMMSNVVFENNNFTSYGAISSNNDRLLNGLHFTYPIFNNFKVINSIDSVKMASPRLVLNSDFETNGKGLILNNSKGHRYKVIVDETGQLSSVPIVYTL